MSEYRKVKVGGHLLFFQRKKIYDARGKVLDNFLYLHIEDIKNGHVTSVEFSQNEQTVLFNGARLLRNVFKYYRKIARTKS